MIGAAHGLDVETVLMEGYRRVDEWYLIEHAIDIVFLLNEDSFSTTLRGVSGECAAPPAHRTVTCSPALRSNYGDAIYRIDSTSCRPPTGAAIACAISSPPTMSERAENTRVTPCSASARQLRR